MTNNTAFNEAKLILLPTLKKYVPVVEKVHGDSHPEFHEVRALFNIIVEKIEKAGLDQPDLSVEFAQLQEVTSNYAIPDDVCESYAAVYNMLAELDKTYFA